jgi:hypothetical protein
MTAARITSGALIRWTDEGGTENVIDFDVAMTEGYEVAADVTEHAVETGSNISDHVRAKNRTFTITAFISNTPIETPTFGMDGATGSVAAATVTVGGKSFTANTFQFSQSFDRVKAVDLALVDLVERGQRITIVTSVRRTENCVVTRYRWDRNVENGNDLDLTLEITRLRTATTRVVAAPRLRSGRAQANRGAQPAVPDNRSALANIDNLSGRGLTGFISGLLR